MARIVGGVDAAEGRYPYMAALLFGDVARNLQFTDTFEPYAENGNPRQFCGGSLITPEVVLTAAHCVENFQGIAGEIEVALGCNDISNEADCQIVATTGSAFSPVYDPVLLGDDVALVFLAEPVEFETVALAGPNIAPSNGEKVIGMGWGATFKASEAPAKQLQEVGLDVVEVDECIAQLENMFGFSYQASGYDGTIDTSNFDTLICTIGDGEDVCFGDSGGPLVYGCETADVPDLQIGLVSFGLSCALEGAPGAFESVNSAPALDFIAAEFAARNLNFDDITFIDDLNSYCPEQPVFSPRIPTPFPTFDLNAVWVCDPAFFAAGDGCDCECGASDPDCEVFSLSQVTFGCNPDEVCFNDQCILESELTDVPTTSPTFSPTTSPTTPTTSPTTSPSFSPTTSPTFSPTFAPSTSPTTSPTVQENEENDANVAVIASTIAVVVVLIGLFILWAVVFKGNSGEKETDDETDKDVSNAKDQI